MRIRILLAVGVTLTFVACADSSTAPRLSPGKVSRDEITCRSGYHIATRDDGSQSCEADVELRTSTPAFAAPRPAAPMPAAEPPAAPTF